MNNWVVLAILGGLFSVLFNFGFKKILNSHNDTTILSWWYEILRVIFVLPFVIFSSGTIFDSKTLLLLLVIGLTEFLSIYYFSKMHKYSELSVSTTVLRLRIVWIPLVAAVLIHEKLYLNNYLGILLIFVGFFLVSGRKKFVFDKSIYFPLICSVITAFSSVFIKQVANNVSPSVIVLAMSLPSVFIFPLFMKNWKGRAVGEILNHKLWVVTASMASVFAQIFQNFALKLGSATQVSGLYQSVSIVSIFMGIFVLGEKNNIVSKILGGLVVIFGAYLLI